MSSIMRARNALPGRGEEAEVIGGPLRAEGCWTFNARDQMPRSSPLTAHPLTATAKNAPASTPPSRESGFVRCPIPAVRKTRRDRLSWVESGRPTVLRSWMPIPHRRVYMERYGGGSIVVSDYDPAWPATFEQERTSLHTALGPLVLTIEHIGSTAVPGVAAKPIIDLQLSVRSLAEARSSCVGPL